MIFYQQLLVKIQGVYIIKYVLKFTHTLVFVYSTIEKKVPLVQCPSMSTKFKSFIILIVVLFGPSQIHRIVDIFLLLCYSRSRNQFDL